MIITVTLKRSARQDARGAELHPRAAGTGRLIKTTMAGGKGREHRPGDQAASASRLIATGLGRRLDRNANR